MDPSQPNPGDKVISLAALMITTTIITGAVNSAIVVWMFDQPWWLSVAAFFAVIIIWIFAKIIGSMFFTIKDTHVIVVKSGESALSSTLKAAFIGAILSLFVFGYTFAYILGGSQFFQATWQTVSLVSVVIGVLWGALSALL